MFCVLVDWWLQQYFLVVGLFPCVCIMVLCFMHIIWALFRRRMKDEVRNKLSPLTSSKRNAISILNDLIITFHQPL